MKDFFKQKQIVIGSWLILPVFLVAFQLAAAFFIFPDSKTGETAQASDQPPQTGSVLGASIDLRSQPPAPPMPVPPLLSADDLKKISAKSFLVYDKSNNDQILAQRSPDTKLQIASLTKLMTGLLAYQYLDFGAPITIQKAGLTKTQPIVNYLQNDQVPAGDIFNSMIVGSCNDSAQVLGRAVQAVSGQNIVDLMNQKAQSLGMSQTSFANPIGFDTADNYSTALDLQKLIDETQNYAAFSNLGKTQSLNFTGSTGLSYHVDATNTLLKSHPELMAIKTGHTLGAKGAMATKVLENGQEIVILVLGSSDREQDTLTLKQLVADRLAW